MPTNKDIIKVALVSAIATHGVGWVIENWDWLLDTIINALSTLEG